MKAGTFWTYSKPAGLAPCLFMGIVLLLSAAGCDREDVTSTDDISDGSGLNDTHAAVYVDASAGSDSHDGSSPTCKGNGTGPKKTIQAGLDVTPVDGICRVAPGVYCEQITMAEGVTLAGAGAEKTFIDGGNLRGNVISIRDCNAPQTVVYGFTIRNGSCYGDNAGIRIQDSGNVLIKNNVITANKADGIRVYSASARILNNTIAGNGRNGIMACSSAGLEVANNIIADNIFMWPAGCEFGWGLYCTELAVINSTYNDVWRNNNDYGVGTEGICVPGAGDLSIDPMFVDPFGDFHLSGGSPCIDAGIYVGLPYRGAAPDMGAFEYRK